MDSKLLKWSLSLWKMDSSGLFGAKLSHNQSWSEGLSLIQNKIFKVVHFIGFGSA